MIVHEVASPKSKGGASSQFFYQQENYDDEPEPSDFESEEEEAEQEVEDLSQYELQQEYLRLQEELQMLKQGRGRVNTSRAGIPPLNLTQDQLLNKNKNQKIEKA